MARSKEKIKHEPAVIADEQAEKAEMPQRLCSEIQLFDLCEKDACKFRKGRFCTEPAVLARFEAISDDEDENSTEQFLADEEEEMYEDDLSYDEGIGEFEGEEPEDEE